MAQQRQPQRRQAPPPEEERKRKRKPKKDLEEIESIVKMLAEHSIRVPNKENLTGRDVGSLIRLARAATRATTPRLSSIRNSSRVTALTWWLQRRVAVPKTKRASRC